jgi:hypothetical protein
MNQIPTVTVEDDVDDNEIVVVAQRLEQQITMFGILLLAAAPSNTMYNFPCIGSVGARELASLVQRLRFKITDEDYGPGRAGKNRVGEDGPMVPIDINAEALKGYDALPGGLSYLVAHEMTHALKKMQEYDKAMWDSYLAGAGANLTHDQRVDQYPDSNEFKQNEARTNTVGRALIEALNRDETGFEPTNGYQTC